MKKIYMIALCSLICLSASADGLRFKTSRGHKGGRHIVRKEAKDAVWRPVSQTDYMHDGEDWMELGSVEFTYDLKGNCTGELVNSDGYYSRTATAYDEYDMPLSILETASEDGEQWENVSRTTYVFDTKVHDFFTERMGYDWSDGDWVRNYKCETNSVTRDDVGNIVELVKSLPLGEGLQPAYKSVWNYGADGRADEYLYYVSDNGADWALYENISYRDIEWENTDGQMTVYGNLRELTEGANRLKSAVVCYEGEPDGHYIVEYPDMEEYPGTGVDFFIRETTNDIEEVGRTLRLQELDANGSLRYTVTEYFDEEGNILPEPTYISVQESINDEHGNQVSFIEKETYDGEEEILAAMKYAYVYDDNGNVKEMTASEYDYDSMEYYPTERTVYGDYVDAALSGVKCVADIEEDIAWSVSADEVSAAGAGLRGLSVYSLQGVCLRSAVAESDRVNVDMSDLLPGLYIVRADGAGTSRRVMKR